MNIAHLRRRRVLIPLSLGLVLIVIAAVVFNPGFQRKFLLKELSPHVEQLAVDYILVTPWSAHLRGANVRYRGGHFVVGEARLRYNPIPLLWHVISIRELALAGTSIDLRDFKPEPTPATVFRGVLASLGYGYGVSADRVAIEGQLELPDAREVTLKIGAAALKPNGSGELTIDTLLTLGTSADTVHVTGTLGLTQLERGRFTELRAALLTNLALQRLPAPEPLKLTAVITAANTEPAAAAHEDSSNTPPPPLPETMEITVVSLDTQAKPRATLEVKGVYDGRRGVLDGNYQLALADTLLTPYAGTRPLPDLDEYAHGHVTFNLPELSTALNVESELKVSALVRVLEREAGLPEPLTIKTSAQLEISAPTLDLTSLDTTVTAADTTTVLALKLKDALALDLNAPNAFLAQDRTLLTLDLPGVPLRWLTAFLPGYTITGGALAAAFELTTNAKSTLKLVPTTATTITALNVNQGEVNVLTNASASLKPSLSYSTKYLRGALAELVVKNGETTLASADLSFASPNEFEQQRTFHLQSDGKLDVDAVGALPPLKARQTQYPLPSTLSLSYQGEATAQGSSLRLDKLNARLTQSQRPQLLSATLQQPFTLQLGSEQQTNPRGSLLTLGVRDLQLAWLTPFLPAIALEGSVKSADFSLAAGADNDFTLSALAPLVIDGLNVARNGERLLDRLAIRFKPELRYAPNATRLHYAGLSVASGRHTLLQGAGHVQLVPGKTDQTIAAAGRLEVDLNVLAKQPMISRALRKSPNAPPLRATVVYDLEQQAATTRLAALGVTLAVGSDSKIALTTTPGLTLRSHIGENESLAAHAVGQATLTVTDLSSAALSEFLPDPRLSFSAAEGVLQLSSDGNLLTATSTAPLAIRNLALQTAEGTPLKPLTLILGGTLRALTDHLEIDLDPFQIVFQDRPDQAAVNGRVALEIDPKQVVKLQKLSAHLQGDLPQLFDQPALLPGHRLRQGTLHSDIEITPAGSIEAVTLLDGLRSDKPLAIESLKLPLSGRLREDGNGFDFTMPVVGSGKSGATDALVTATFAPQPNAPAEFKLNLASERFYLNDILATIAAIRKPVPEVVPAVPGASAPPVATPVDETPDKHAFWALLPYHAAISFSCKQMFYTDYLVFNDIAGNIAVNPQQLALTGFNAHFHDSPITLDGDLRFDGNPAAPYDLTLKGRVEDFDLNKFFTELVPGEKPRVEGLFGVKIRAFGRAPNPGQFRNRIGLDLVMNSRDGVFRPLPPDSSLLIGTTPVLELIGETLSYVPTGGFGAGAVTRLVNYIANIDYDLVYIHLIRDETRNLRIKHFLARSPTIRMTATGGVDYVPGKDILDSPLSLDARMNMLGKGAAILYSMDLLRPERDARGYWRGPEFKIWGTPAAAQSNLAEIVKQAGDGTVKGGITRPLSGLIGNLRYRWFAKKIKKEEQREDLKEPDQVTGVPVPSTRTAP